LKTIQVFLDHMAVILNLTGTGASAAQPSAYQLRQVHGKVSKCSSKDVLGENQGEYVSCE
jgi:hypothetical protein